MNNYIGQNNGYGNYRPPQRDNNGWLIGVVVAIGLFFLIGCIAGSAVTYKVFLRIANKKASVAIKEEYMREEHVIEDDFNFEFDHGYREETEEGIIGAEPEEKERTEEGGSRYSEEAGYEKLEDALRYDLAYSIEWESYEYDTDYKNVYIHASYPKIVSETVPNLEFINEAIFGEIQFWVDSFEDYAAEGYFYEEDQFVLEAFAYVTYMDEEKMSVVFSEYGYTDNSGISYLYSINVDMKSGVVLDNASILDMDEEFAVNFRKRNKEQNNAGGYIDAMSDQEIMEYLNSPTNGIVFYTPLGLEVGINVDGGWYTVTYKDYQKYLKKL